MAQALSAAETVWAEEIVLRLPDGRSLRVLLNGTPIRSDDGRMESCIATVQDITPLEEQERLLVELLAMVSHELRTPLAAVKGSISTLREPSGPLNPADGRQFHAAIEDQTDRMNLLIGDLLDVARIETGALAINPEATDLAALVSEARDAFRSGGGRHRIEIDLADDLPWVMADRARMVQVLGNLLSNAARNSPESSPIRRPLRNVGVHRRGGAIGAKRRPAVAIGTADRRIPRRSHGIPSLWRRTDPTLASSQLVQTGRAPQVVG